MTISISTDAIIARVLAFSALRHLNAPDQHPTLIDGDSRPALIALARGGFFMVCCDLLPDIEDTNADQITPDNCELLTIELRPSFAGSLAATRHLAEEIIYLYILAELFAATHPAISSSFSTRCEQTRRRLRNLHRNLPPSLPSLTPHHI